MLVITQVVISDDTVDQEKFLPDLTQNSNSLKRQVTINYLLQDINDIELMGIIENYLKD